MVSFCACLGHQHNNNNIFHENNRDFDTELFFVAVCDPLLGPEPPVENHLFWECLVPLLSLTLSPNQRELSGNHFRNELPVRGSTLIAPFFPPTSPSNGSFYLFFPIRSLTCHFINKRSCVHWKECSDVTWNNVFTVHKCSMITTITILFFVKTCHVISARKCISCHIKKNELTTRCSSAKLPVSPVSQPSHGSCVGGRTTSSLHKAFSPNFKSCGTSNKRRQL